MKNKGNSNTTRAINMKLKSFFTIPHSSHKTSYLYYYNAILEYKQFTKEQKVN